jgi:hypothetical protein
MFRPFAHIPYQIHNRDISSNIGIDGNMQFLDAANPGDKTHVCIRAYGNGLFPKAAPVSFSAHIVCSSLPFPRIRNIHHRPEPEQKEKDGKDGHLSSSFDPGSS